jgi:molybdopterin synthase sulfur carrier subunit
MASEPNPAFTLLYFAAASTYTHKNSELLPAPLPLRSLFTTLESRYPGITAKVLRSCAVTINLEYVDFDLDGNGNPTNCGASEHEGGVMIQVGDEVGIIPPVSSG